LSTNNTKKNYQKKQTMMKMKFYLVVLKPQDLGSVSYKDTATNETSQKTQSIETTATIVTETFQAEEKILTKRNSRKAI
jgi:hypothetical protein